MVQDALRPAITAAKNAVPARSFWFVPQLHGLLYKKNGWYRAAADTVAYRNPTPAEIRAMGYLALAYGAKGIIYYPYCTALEDASSPSKARYNTGLVRREENNNQAMQYFHASNWATFLLNDGSNKKVFTGYKEKWNEAQTLNAKLKTIGPTLASLTWQNAASIHKSQIGNLSQVIKYLYTLKAGGQQDSYPSSTYAEAGHMKDGRNWDYLLVVNRRCAPTQGSLDDRRKMKIQLNKGTGTWAVSQVPSGEYWTLPHNGWFTTSLFDPGEGRLYRVAPSVIYVPQNFATIHEALEIAISGQTVQVAAGTYTENINLVVNSGITLKFMPGVTLKMASGKKLTINGTLSAQGTSGNRITFQPSSGTWYGIKLNYCYMTTVKYCTIQNASTGMRAYHTALNVDNCSFTSNITGIEYDNQSSGYVKYSTISSSTGNGIECAQNSNPTIRSYNRIWSNVPTGVYGDYNSLPELGTLSYYGNNSIKNNYPDEVWSDNSNSLYAQKNYWGSSSPNPNVSDNVIWEPYLTSDPTGGGLLKPFADDLATNDSFTHTVNDTIGKSEFQKAYQVYLNGDYAAAIILFDQLVNNYPENHTGWQSLALIDHCYQNLDDVIASSNYLNQVAAAFAGKEISGLAKSIAVGHLIRSGDYDVAIGYSQQILTEFVDKVIAKYALYDLGTIYWYFKEDYAAGEKYYRQLIAAYPDDDLSISALATLGEWKPIEPNPEPPLVTAQAEVKEFSLDQNYPNPFNPETTIRYHLAEASQVTIKIYNLLGEEVIILVDKSHLQGNHAIQWNGRDRFGNMVTNGVYWVRMQVGKFVAQRKLILLR